MPTVVIINPAAGHGRGARLTDTVSREARRHWPDAVVLHSGAPGEAVRLARDAATQGAGSVIAVGGDGTVHEAANGLLDAGRTDLPALGVVPVGTGNDFARLSGTSGLRPGAALAALARGRVRRCDAGRAGEEWFVNSLGIGFGAEVAARVARQRRWRGFPAYLAAVLGTLHHRRPLRVTVTTDRARWTDAVLLLEVGNGASTGGGFRLTPDALPDDGQLDFCAVAPMSLPAILLKLPLAALGRHTALPEVRMGRTAALTIVAPEPLRYHLDGEVRHAEQGSLTVTTAEGALPVLQAAR